MELVGRRTRDDEAATLALVAVVVGAASGEPLRRPPPRCLRRRAGAWGGDEVVVRRPPRRPPLLDRAENERDEPLHPHLATISAPPLQKRQIEEEILLPSAEDSKHLVDRLAARVLLRGSHCEE
jgi:hypothetical protein